MLTHRGAGRLSRFVPALLALALAPIARADDAPRAAVARCASETGSLLRREAPGKPWQLVKEGEDLHAGDQVVGARPGAIVSANGAVRMAFLGDPSGTSPFPVIETAVILRQPEEGADLAFAMERGRVDLTNLKPDGQARIRLHVGDRVHQITLLEPGTRVAEELYGRWPRGVRFIKDAKPDHRPAVAFAFLVLKGKAEVKGRSHTYTLNAPPGPALLQGDESVGLKAVPQNLQSLPPWAEPDGHTEAERKAYEALATFRRLAAEKGIGEAVDQMVRSDDPAQRKVAVYLMGALDDLPRLGEAMSTTRYPDVWDTGVLALRHWIGRGPGQDQKLYQALVERRDYKPAEAATVLQLLHSFGEDDLAQPETFQLLLNELTSDKLAIRGLAYWHLMRLVPAGKQLGYDPLAPKEERDRAAKEWKKLIPPGQLPPAAGPEGR
jgi:hypothetical protein